MPLLDPVDAWIRVHHPAFAALFVAGVALGVVADLVLVARGRRTISQRVWDATAGHPTAVAFGVLLTVLVCYGLSPTWWLVAAAGMLGGHLFLHD